MQEIVQIKKLYYQVLLKGVESRFFNIFFKWRWLCSKLKENGGQKTKIKYSYTCYRVMLGELYSFIILCPEPPEVSYEKILCYYRFHTHSFWWCQTLILSDTQKWNWHLWLLFASYRRIQSTNCSFLSVCFVWCILYIHVQSRS